MQEYIYIQLTLYITVIETDHWIIFHWKVHILHTEFFRLYTKDISSHSEEKEKKKKSLIALLFHYYNQLSKRKYEYKRIRNQVVQKEDEAVNLQDFQCCTIVPTGTISGLNYILQQSEVDINSSQISFYYSFFWNFQDMITFISKH